MGPIHTLDDFIDMLRRRARLIVQVVAAGCLISMLYALSQQQMYASSEVIQIARSNIADDLAPSTVSDPTTHHFQLIQQRLTTRNNMLQIIDGFGLYAEFPDLKPNEMVDRLRRSVLIEEIADDGAMLILSVTAEMSTPGQAQLVAHEIARRLIEQSNISRIKQGREILDFLTAQESSLTAERAALEDQIALIHETPPDIERKLGALERQLQQVQRELAVVSTRRAEAEVGLQLESERQVERLAVIEPAALSDDPVTGSRTRMAMLGGVLSAMLAVALAFVLDLRLPVIRSAQQMERETGIVPVVSVPFLDATPLRPSRWQRLRAWFDGLIRSENSIPDKNSP